MLINKIKHTNHCFTINYRYIIEIKPVKNFGIFNKIFSFVASISKQTLKLKAMSDIAARVKSIIVEKLGVNEADVTEDASFTDLGADSLDTVELVMEFEKEFNISIPDDIAEKISTVGEAIKYIEENVKQ